MINCMLLLSGCTVTKEITRYEGKVAPKLGSPLIQATDIKYERVFEFYRHYYQEYSDIMNVYMPRVGEFSTEDGEKFVTMVESIDLVVKFPPRRGTTMSFTLSVYSLSGDLIISEKMISKQTENEATGELIPYTEVSEAMEKYWSAAKTTSDELFAEIDRGGE